MKWLLALSLLLVSMAAQAASPEESYLAARDAAIAKFSSPDAPDLEQHEAALAELAGMLRPFVESQIHRCHVASSADAMGRACSLRAVAAKHDGMLSRAAKAPSLNPNQAAWSRRPVSPARRGWAAACRRAAKRLFNAQQNVDRCDPSGRDPGRRSAR